MVLERGYSDGVDCGGGEGSGTGVVVRTVLVVVVEVGDSLVVMLEILEMNRDRKPADEHPFHSIKPSPYLPTHAPT